MFGNQGILNRIILDKKDCPIYPEGNVSQLRIIEVLFDEQWKELGRQYQFSEALVLSIPNLGRWEVKNSQLRKYIRNSIKALRKLRGRIKKLSEQKGFEAEKSLTVALEKDLSIKLSIALKQLNKIRWIWIHKKIAWQNSIKA